MKGIVKLTLVGFMVLGMMIGTSMASEIDIQGKPTHLNGPVAFDPDVTTTPPVVPVIPGGPVTVDQRWVASGILDYVNFDDATTWPGPNVLTHSNDRAIAYYSSVALQADSTLKFTVTGGTVKPDATLYLLAWTSNGVLGGPGWLTAASLTDWDPTGRTYGWVRFQISNTNILAGTVFWGKIPAADGFGFLNPSLVNILPAGTVLMLSANDAAAANLGTVQSLGFVLDQSASGNITIAMDEARDNNAQILNAPVAGAETIMVVGAYSVAQILHQQGGLIAGAATSTIDVEAVPSRTKFRTEGRTGHLTAGDTDATDSECGLQFTNTAEYGLTLTANDSFTLTVKRGDVLGVNSISLYNGTAYVAMTQAGSQWTRNGNFSTYPITQPKGILIHVGDVTPLPVLSVGTWSADLTINFSQDTPEPKSLGTVPVLTNADSHIWGINGSQFIVPYLNSDSTNYGTYIVISNTSGNDATLYADVWTDGGVANGNSAVTQYASNINIGTVYAGSTRILMPADVEALVTTALGGAAHVRYMIKVIAIAPDDSVHVTAMQNNGGGTKRAIPVLTYKDHSWKE